MTTAQSPAHSRITIESDDGFLITGTWAQRSGGNRTAGERRYREGGELFKEEVGGAPASTENMTLSRPYKRDRDIALLRWAHQKAGAVILTITEQPLDDAGVAFGSPLVDQARLLACNRPDVNADEVTGVQRIELTVAPFGELG